MANDKNTLLEESLLHISEKAGDITPIIFARYYQLCPEAKQIFTEHGYENTDKLEATMVDWFLYSIMTWLRHPTEVVGVLSGAATHHKSLHIPFTSVLVLMEVAFAVCIENIQNDSSVRLLWCGLRDDIIAALKSSEGIATD